MCEVCEDNIGNATIAVALTLKETKTPIGYCAHALTRLLNAMLDSAGLTVEQRVEWFQRSALNFEAHHGYMKGVPLSDVDKNYLQNTWNERTFPKPHHGVN